MFYQRTPTRYYLRPYQQDVDEGNMFLPQHPACMGDTVLRQGSVSSGINSTVFRGSVHDGFRQQPDGNDLHCVWNKGRGGTPATECRMTSYQHDVMQQTAGGAPAVTSPPSPYDCKPPYSYISLIAMAIESSPDRRYVSCEQFHERAQSSSAVVYAGFYH